MLSYAAYKLIHLIGIFMLLLSLGAALVLADSERGSVTRWRRRAGLTSGIGLVLILVAGFGLTARLALPWPWPAWTFLKMLLWIGFGLILALINRRRDLVQSLWWVVLLLAAIAAFLATFKPF